VLTFAALVALSGIVAALPPTATAVSLAPDVGAIFTLVGAAGMLAGAAVTLSRLNAPLGAL